MKWLENTNKCPICKQISKKKDLRVIYSTSLTSVDDSKIKALEKELVNSKLEKIQVFVLL